MAWFRPRAGETAVTGLYFALPIIVLIWSILPTPDRLSPALSAFLASIFISIVALTHHPIKAWFRKQGNFGHEFRRGLNEWVDGMISGARNMISIGIATGVAGIIIGTVSLTGAHQVIGSFVEMLSGGSLLLMLILVAIMSLILGMGLPTTANYIIVSSLMAPVIVELGAANGLLVPLIAVHLFVFYFGILADDTPPVGLAAFAAAAISRGDPFRTGIQGFAYDIRTALLPFMFLFNTELLLINVTFGKAVLIFVIAIIAMMLFAAATQGYFLTRNKIWETVLLLAVAFTLFRPGFWLDMVQPPYDHLPGTDVHRIVEAQEPGAHLRVWLAGPDFSSPDETNRLSLLVPLGATGDSVARLKKGGLNIMLKDGKAVLEEPLPGTPFAHLNHKFDFYTGEPVVLSEVLLPTERTAKEVFYLPALAIVGLIIMLQLRRRKRTGPQATG